MQVGVMAWVYILQSEKSQYYIGSTANLERRLKQHFTGGAHTTSRMKGLKLVFSQEFKSSEKARIVERKLKSWKRKDFIDKIVSDGEINFLDA